MPYSKTIGYGRPDFPQKRWRKPKLIRNLKDDSEYVVE